MISYAAKMIIAPTSTWNTAVGNNIHLGVVPSSASIPYVAIYPISRIELTEGSIASERLQFTCCAKYLSSATTIAETIMGKLKLFTGVSTAVPNIVISAVYYDNMIYQYDYSNDTHCQILDMVFKYKR